MPKAKKQESAAAARPTPLSSAKSTRSRGKDRQAAAGKRAEELKHEDAPANAASKKGGAGKKAASAGNAEAAGKKGKGSKKSASAGAILNHAPATPVTKDIKPKKTSAKSQAAGQSSFQTERPKTSLEDGKSNKERKPSTSNGRPSITPQPAHLQPHQPSGAPSSMAGPPPSGLSGPQAASSGKVPQPYPAPPQGQVPPGPPQQAPPHGYQPMPPYGYAPYGMPPPQMGYGPPADGGYYYPPQYPGYGYPPPPPHYAGQPAPAANGIASQAPQPAAANGPPASSQRESNAGPTHKPLQPQPPGQPQSSMGGVAGAAAGPGLGPGSMSGNNGSSASGQSSRQRTAVACRYCRKRKIRCTGISHDPNDPRCSNCRRLDQECVYAPVGAPVVGGPYRPSGGVLSGPQPIAAHGTPPIQPAPAPGHDGHNGHSHEGTPGSAAGHWHAGGGHYNRPPAASYAPQGQQHQASPYGTSPMPPPSGAAQQSQQQQQQQPPQNQAQNGYRGPMQDPYAMRYAFPGPPPPQHQPQHQQPSSSGHQQQAQHAPGQPPAQGQPGQAPPQQQEYAYHSQMYPSYAQHPPAPPQQHQQHQHQHASPQQQPQQPSIGQPPHNASGAPADYNAAAGNGSNANGAFGRLKQETYAVYPAPPQSAGQNTSSNQQGNAQPQAGAQAGYGGYERYPPSTGAHAQHQQQQQPHAQPQGQAQTQGHGQGQGQYQHPSPYGQYPPPQQHYGQTAPGGYQQGYGPHNGHSQHDDHTGAAAAGPNSGQGAGAGAGQGAGGRRADVTRGAYGNEVTPPQSVGEEADNRAAASIVGGGLGNGSGNGHSNNGGSGSGGGGSGYGQHNYGGHARHSSQSYAPVPQPYAAYAPQQQQQQHAQHAQPMAQGYAQGYGQTYGQPHDQGKLQTPSYAHQHGPASDGDKRRRSSAHSQHGGGHSEGKERSRRSNAGAHGAGVVAGPAGHATRSHGPAAGGGSVLHLLNPAGGN